MNGDGLVVGSLLVICIASAALILLPTAPEAATSSPEQAAAPLGLDQIVDELDTWCQSHSLGLRVVFTPSGQIESYECR